jgi:hypothetical protein
MALLSDREDEGDISLRNIKLSLNYAELEFRKS